MTDIETRLRRELKREAERLQPEFLRPLRPPPAGLPSVDRSSAQAVSAQAVSARLAPARMAPARIASPRRLRVAGQRPVAPVRRWLASAGAVAAGAALAGLSIAARSAEGGASIRDEFQGATAPPPRFYVALTGQQPAERAVVHDSLSGQELSSTAVPAVIQDAAHFELHLAAAGDDHTFAIVAEDGIGHRHPVLRVLILRVGADGRTPSLRLLPGRFGVTDPAARVTGVALSADSTSLAAVLATATPRPARGYVETVSLTAGTARTWVARGAAPVEPSWVNGGRYLGFVTWRRQWPAAPGVPAATTQVRLLDTAAAGRSLLSSRVLATSGKSLGLISSALVSPDGQTILATTYRNVAGRHGQGRAIDQLVSLSAQTGRVTRRFRTAVAGYRNPQQMSAADFRCQVLSLAGGAGASQALVQCPRLARLGGGRLSQLPQVAAPPAVTW